MGVCDPRLVRAGGEAGRVVGEGDDRQALEDDRRPCPFDVFARPHPADPGFAQVRERVQQRLDPIVERVIVGELNAVDAEMHERLDGLGWRAEVEHFRQRLAALGDAALEVDNAEVGRARKLGYLGGDD
jgi:hypothetical protein